MGKLEEKADVALSAQAEALPEALETLGRYAPWRGPDDLELDAAMLSNFAAAARELLDAARPSEAEVELLTLAVLGLNRPRSEGGMNFRHTHYMARKIVRTVLAVQTQVKEG